MDLTRRPPLSLALPRSALFRAFRHVCPMLCLFLAAGSLYGQGLPFFLDQVRSGPPEQRATAFEELATFQGPEVEAALAAGIADNSAEVRRAAAIASIGHSSEVVTTALIMAFHDQSLDMQHTAISVFIMNDQPHPSGYRPLLSLLEAPDQKTRAYAAWAVGLYKNPGSIGRLQKLFDVGDELQRANVCWALGAIGSPDGVELVHCGLKDTAVSVREKAAAAAGQIGHSTSVGQLNALLKVETDESVKRAAGHSLELIGEKLPAR